MQNNFEFSEDSIGYWPMIDSEPMVIWFPLASARGQELMREYEEAQAWKADGK